MAHASPSEFVDTVIIGAGQAGLSVGYYLSRLGVRFVILDGNDRVGDNWRGRWDSLRLFTPARFNGLAGLPFPAPPHYFPTKDEMADYLETYAAHFRLPVRTGVRVGRVSRTGRTYTVAAGGHTIEAAHVVVAMASYQRRRVPPFAAELDPSIVQLHSSEYRNPSQLGDGPVLVVGAGNSGSEIALEAARAGSKVWMAGRDTGHVPFRIDGLAARLILFRLVLRGLFHRIITVRTPIGRKLRAKMLVHGGPLIRVRPHQLAAAGIERVPRVAAVRGGRPLLADGRVLEPATVIWCTGFDAGFSWIDLPVFDRDRQPMHDRGVVREEPGLYFVGLQFLYAFSSTMIHGVARDAKHVARVIHQRERTRPVDRMAPSVLARAG